MKIPFPAPHDGSCGPAQEEALNLYADGELGFEAQPALFAHLATCADCRRSLAALLEFRRISRQEMLAVPAAADDAFFQRLDQLKRRDEHVDRQADRRPLWHVRTRISLSLAATVALLLFAAGVLLPRTTGEILVRPQIEGVEERVEFAPPGALRPEAVYVFYPGLTVEATKLEATSSASPL